ncbi:MAG: HAMP domain-containing histidine kinase [Planctomycetes bacterium]|nr:HAMP domain-containing histidine kinase [Planctomycetota bacterium]
MARLPLWTTLVALLFAAQLGWWGFSLWMQGEELHLAAYNSLVERRDRATAEFHQQRAAFPHDPRLVWEDLAALYPKMVFVPTAPVDATSSTTSTDLRTPIQISGDALGALAAAQRGRRAMILGEGSLFFVLWAAAITYLLRTAKRDQQLALQESNFLHAVTHEFRSPIQAMRLAAESIQRVSAGGKEKEYAAMLLVELQRTETLVENVLAVGRIEAEAFNPTPTTRSLSLEVADSIKRWKERNQARASLLQEELEEGLLAAIDVDGLDPILHNLLDNALKYGGGKPFRVRVYREEGNAVLSVEDQGQGFTAQDSKRLFERFWRAGKETVRTAPGTGLGLFLVHELVRAQKATIQAKSPGPQLGAIFQIRWAEERA